MAIAPDELHAQRIEKGIRLYKLRANSRWYSHAQESFAQRIGYQGTKAASNISRIENGERSLPEDKEVLAAQVLASDPDLVDDAEYLLDFLRCRHSDLRGCLYARPKFRLVDDQPSSNPELDLTVSPLSLLDRDGQATDVLAA